MSIISAGATDIGRKRQTNQDSIYLNTDLSFFAVADGMGGHNGGDFASQLTVKIIPELLGSEHNLAPPELMNHIITKINQTIFQESETNLELKGMGTTIAALHINGGQLVIGNVGDSRVYLIHKKMLYQLTRDHSFVQEKLNLGLCTREQALNDPQKNVLVRSVGFEADVQVDVFSYRICKDDLFLICSDGLHGKVTDEEIVHIINSAIPNPSSATQAQLDKAVQDLIAEANKKGGHDNISVIISLAQS